MERTKLFLLSIKGLNSRRGASLRILFFLFMVIFLITVFFSLNTAYYAAHKKLLEKDTQLKIVYVYNGGEEVIYTQEMIDSMQGVEHSEYLLNYLDYKNSYYIEYNNTTSALYPLTGYIIDERIPSIFFSAKGWELSLAEDVSLDGFIANERFLDAIGMHADLENYIGQPFSMFDENGNAVFNGLVLRGILFDGIDEPVIILPHEQLPPLFIINIDYCLALYPYPALAVTQIVHQAEEVFGEYSVNAHEHFTDAAEYLNNLYVVAVNLFGLWGGMLLCAMLISLVFLVVSNINSRKKYYGIIFAQGLSLKKIAAINIIEMSILFVSAFMLASCALAAVLEAIKYFLIASVSVELIYTAKSIGGILGISLLSGMAVVYGIILTSIKLFIKKNAIESLKE